MHPQKLKAAYDSGKNLMALIRESKGVEGNDETTIELSYDLQSGSYVDFAETEKGRRQKTQVGNALATVLAELKPIDSLLEAGVGEATTLWHTINAIDSRPKQLHGFDLCWSRIACGAAWWERQTPRFPVQLATASLSEIPYENDSFDVVLTAHAIEPNRGREAEILRELYRVASRYVVLLEPCYEIASPEARLRMDEMGYCRDLPKIARELGYEVLRHEPFQGPSVPHNPAAVTVIAKSPHAPPAEPRYACPAFGTPMVRLEDCLYSPDSMRAYPILGGIPCLRTSSAIIASKRLDFVPEESKETPI